MGRFYENFERLCKASGKSPSAVVLSIGRSKNAASNWKLNDTIPKQDELEELAEALGCTVADFFKDEEEQKFDQLYRYFLLDLKANDKAVERGKKSIEEILTTPMYLYKAQSLPEGGKRGQKPQPKDDPLDDYEKDFIRIYKLLDAKKRIKLMNAVYEFDEEGDGK